MNLSCVLIQIHGLWAVAKKKRESWRMVASKTHPGGPISSERCLFPKKWTNKKGVEVVLGFEAGWWFQICFMFIPTWGNDPILTNIFQMG